MDQIKRGPDEKYCPSCGRIIYKEAEICPHCGVRVAFPEQPDLLVLHRRWIIVLLLCVFLGPLGIHRFYVGKIGTGILMIVTAGGLGIWVIIDIIMIVLGRFSDSEGNLIS